MTLTHVDGVEILERQKAIGMSGTAIEGKPLESVDMVLLADGRTLFHCVHKNAVDCEYTNESVGSITSHQRTHSDRMEAKRAKEKADELAAQLAEIEAEKARKKANYTAGARKAAETKAAKRAQAPSEIGGAGNGHVRAAGTVTKSVIGNTDLAEQAQKVIIAFNAMQASADEFQKVLLGYMRMAQTITDAPAIDPEIIEKAKKYDALKGMFA